MLITQANAHAQSSIRKDWPLVLGRSLSEQALWGDRFQLNKNPTPLEFKGAELGPERSDDEFLVDFLSPLGSLLVSRLRG